MSIEQEIRQILERDLFVETPAEEIGGDDSLRAEHGVDSLGFVELSVQCENRFGVKFGDAFTPENFRDIDSIARLVRELQQEGE